MEWYWWVLIVFFIGGVISEITDKEKKDNNSSYSDDNSYTASSSSYHKNSGSRDSVWSSGGSESCNHSWSYSHKGADGNNIYECSKCGRHEKRM